MCNLSATQVVASAMAKSETKVLSIGQLVRYNKLLLTNIEDYRRTIDLSDLSFEFSNSASDFGIKVNANYEKVIFLKDKKKFNYDLYAGTMPKEISKTLNEIELPV